MGRVQYAKGFLNVGEQSFRVWNGEEMALLVDSIDIHK